MLPTLGTVIDDRYELLSLIARGGIWMLYIASDYFAALGLRRRETSVDLKGLQQRRRDRLASAPVCGTTL